MPGLEVLEISTTLLRDFCLMSPLDGCCRAADLPSLGKTAIAVSPTAAEGDAVTPQGKTPGDAETLWPSGHGLPTGLAAIADAAEHVSPFSSEHKVLQ